MAKLQNVRSVTVRAGRALTVRDLRDLLDEATENYYDDDAVITTTPYEDNPYIHKPVTNLTIGEAL